jgi:putative ATPase
MILWGPPGCGKTTLAHVLAESAGRRLIALSATDSGLREVRDALQQAEKRGLFEGEKAPVLFIDEIHRFHKGQQDALLSAVEKGTVVLIGATTENPSFEVNAALLSRCRVFVLNPLSDEDLRLLGEKALKTDSALKDVQLDAQAWPALLHLAQGDARRLLNLLELAAGLRAERPLLLTAEDLRTAASGYPLRYDKSGDMHYDIISAFIKSVRGSDPNAAVYYLARMIESGESLRFICRRMLILAAEDIGLANPLALVVAEAAFRAADMVGYPEARIIMAQCAIYLACSPKSNSVYVAINQAQEVVKQHGDVPVPLSLRNAPTRLMKDLGYGRDYLYSHDFTEHFVIQEFMPESLSGMKLYEPADNPNEQKIRERLKALWKGKYGY